MQTFGDVLVGLLVYGGGPTAIAYVVFRFLGEKWIESKFAAELEIERHAHAKELQELKKKLDSELSRIVKLQDREFTVLADAWDLLQDALDHVINLVALFRQYPDLSRLNTPRLTEFLENSQLSAVHKAEVLCAEDKNKHYQELIFWYDLNTANRACWKYRSYISKNSIFLRPELSDLFERIDGVIRNAVISREVGEESGDKKFWVQEARNMHEDIRPLLADLRAKVREVLRDSV
jgi:hypothetical protein